MLFISKGVPYIKEQKNSARINGKTIQLTNNQWILWKFFYGDIKTYGQLMKYIGKLCMEGILITKDLMQQTIMQLKSLGLLAYTEKDEIIDRFILLFSNRIAPITEKGIEDDVDKNYYDLIVKYDSMSVADIIAYESNLQYDELTNGYTEDYLRYVYEHTYKIGLPGIVMDSILRMIKSGNLFVC